MKSDLSISVIIVTLNRAEYLKDALASLTKQIRPPDEVIVVDNGSTDNTKEVILSFGDRLPIKYVYEGKKGIPHARNAGIKSATNDIIAFTDDDCVAHENWLKYIENTFIRDPNIGAVGGEVSYLKAGYGIIEEFYRRNMGTELVEKEF